MLMQFTREGHTQLRGNAILITSTITVVLFSTVVCMTSTFSIMFLWNLLTLITCVSSLYMKVFGLMTKPLVRFLTPTKQMISGGVSSDAITPLTMPFLGDGLNSESELFVGTSQAPHQAAQRLLRPINLRTLFTTPTRTVHYYWRKFDDAFMRPVFGGRGFVPYARGSPTEEEAIANANPWQDEPK